MHDRNDGGDLATKVANPVESAYSKYTLAYVSEFDHNDKFCLAVWLIFVTTHLALSGGRYRRQ